MREKMYFNERTKKFFKVFMLVAFVFVLAGCARNLDENGKLIAERAIDATSPWSIDAGIFDFILTIPLAKLIIFISQFVGNIGWGVICVTILVNIILLPVMIKSTVSSQKMQMIQSDVEKIQRKYAGRKDQASQMRQSAELQALYKKNDISLLGSFAMLLTLPIMIAMWQSVQRIKLLYETTFIGLNLGVTPLSQIFSGHYQYVVVIIIVGVSQFLAMEINNIMLKRNPRYRPSKQQNSMRTMNYVMTAMIIWFSLSMSLYWITTSVITIARTVYIQLYHIEKK